MNVINVDRNGQNIPVKVFKNDNGKYSVQISKKVGEGYENKYFPVEFLKDVELDNGTEILIKNAFLSFFDWEYNDQKGTKWLIKITAFEKAYNNEPVLKPEPKIDNTWGSAKSIETDADDSLPFY